MVIWCAACSRWVPAPSACRRLHSFAAQMCSLGTQAGSAELVGVVARRSKNRQTETLVEAIRAGLGCQNFSVFFPGPFPSIAAIAAWPAVAENGRASQSIHIKWRSKNSQSMQLCRKWGMRATGWTLAKRGRDYWAGFVRFSLCRGGRNAPQCCSGSNPRANNKPRTQHTPVPRLLSSGDRQWFPCSIINN